jgi:pyridoxine 4-dehydrogenase
MATEFTLCGSDTFPIGSVRVHRVGFGAMQLPGPGVKGPPRDREEALAVLRRAVELGVNHIDTAQYYGPDVANELIHEALHPYPEDLALVSKVGARRDAAGGWVPAQRPDELRSAVEDNLRSLAVDQLTAVNLRILDGPTRADQPRLEDQLAEMVAMREEGLVSGVGISNVGLDQLEIAIRLAGIVCVQNAFSLLDQSDAPVLERCIEERIAYVPFFPLGSAFPTIPKVTDSRAVRDVATRLRATPAQVGLAWLLARAENVLLIPGTSSRAHLEENLACASVQLSESDLDELDRGAESAA